MADIIYLRLPSYSDGSPPYNEDNQSQIYEKCFKFSEHLGNVLSAYVEGGNNIKLITAYSDFKE